MELNSFDTALFIWTLISFAALLFTAWAIVSLGKNKSLNPNSKLTWAILILIVPVMGAFAYFYVVVRNNKATLRS